jgi:hypothetical protein
MLDLCRLFYDLLYPFPLFFLPVSNPLHNFVYRLELALGFFEARLFFFLGNHLLVTLIQAKAIDG